MIKKSKATSCSSSFRDCSGRVYFAEDSVLRTINDNYKPHYERCEESGFFKEAISSGLLLDFSEVSPILNSWKTISASYLPFVSYPYEWCFGQLKDAALHTLDLLDLSLKHGLVLKDASAYNVVFCGAKPLFVDTLSFEIKEEGKPWQAYLQFCQHFLAPLALQAKNNIVLSKMLCLWIDGVPLDIASNLLPIITKFSPSLAMHIHLHAKFQKKYLDVKDVGEKVNNIKLPENALLNLSKSLRNAINGLALSTKISTQWGDYYSDTNYSKKAYDDKLHCLENFAVKYADVNKVAIDVGANEGLYSYHLSKYFKHVLAVDMDYLAVEKLYQRLKNENNKNITPLVFDLCNPSPAIGFANKERLCLPDRVKPIYLSALALVHHLVFGGGIPLDKIADCFFDLLDDGGVCVLEFVPIDDSQVVRLLKARDIAKLPQYSLDVCLDAFDGKFALLEKHDIDDSKRTILVFKKVLK